MSWEMTLVVMVASSVAVALYVAWPLLVGRPEPGPTVDADGPVSMLDELLLKKDATYSAIKELEFDHAVGNLSEQDYRDLARRYEDKAVALLKEIDSVLQGEYMGDVRAPAVAGVVVAAGRSAESADIIEKEVARIRLQRGKAGYSERAMSKESGVEGQPAGRVSSRQPSRALKGNLAEEIEQQVAALRAGKLGGGVRGTPASASSSHLTPTSCPVCGASSRNDAAAFCTRCGAALSVRCAKCGTPAGPEDLFCSGCGIRLVSASRTASAHTGVGESDV